MWNGLRFVTATPVPGPSPARADVACFVGFATARPVAAPAAVLDGLRRRGWAELFPVGVTDLPPTPPPVMIESMESFEALFDGRVRQGGLSWEGALSGAVRDFFRQGGRRCYVVAAGPARPPLTDPAEVQSALRTLIPALLPQGVAPDERPTWTGLAHVLGLPDVSMVCLPDLPYVVGAPPATAATSPAEPVPVPHFVECAEPLAEPDRVRRVAAPGAPRLDDASWGRWRQACNAAAVFLRQHRPDVQLLLALPLFAPGHAGEGAPLPALQGGLGQDLLRSLDDGGIGSAFVQLATPWFRGDTTADRPGGIGPPDGLLAGILAESTLRQGTFRTARGSRLAGVGRLFPSYTAAAIRRPHEAPGGGPVSSLEDRLCVLQAGRSGLELGSDRSTSPDPSWQQGGVSRLMGVLHREVRRAAESVTWEPANEATRTALVRLVEDRLATLTALGALTARGGEPASLVRCDSTTMRQNDIDNGRLIARVEVQPAFAIERITVLISVVNGVGIDLLNVVGVA